MATMVPGSLISVPAPRSAVIRTVAAVNIARRRKTSPEAGRAIEILGHAIEYLADEFSLECMARQGEIAAGMHPRVVAIEILKACNRQVYLSCPEAVTLGDRLRSLLRLNRA